MNEKRFTLNLMKKPSEIEMDGKMISKYDVVRLLNEQQATISQLKEENEQLKKQLSKYDKPKISIFNKDKGDWKWNDNNDIILNLRTGNKFYLRNSGAVENLVGLLNEQQATIQSLKEENEKLKIALSEYGVDFSSLDRFKEAIGYNEMVKKELEDD